MAVIVFAWFGLSVVGALLTISVYALLFCALVLNHGPLDKPQLEVSSTEVAYGPGLATRVPLSDIRYAVACAPPGSDAWPGSTSVVLEMESRVVAGQRYYETKVIQLFCVDVSAVKIAARINEFCNGAGRDANPSVKGLARGKPQTAPYLEP